MGLSANERYMLKKELEKRLSEKERECFEIRQELKKLRSWWTRGGKREWKSSLR